MVCSHKDLASTCFECGERFDVEQTKEYFLNRGIHCLFTYIQDLNDINTLVGVFNGKVLMLEKAKLILMSNSCLDGIYYQTINVNALDIDTDKIEKIWITSDGTKIIETKQSDM